MFTGYKPENRQGFRSYGLRHDWQELGLGSSDPFAAAWNDPNAGPSPVRRAHAFPVDEHVGAHAIPGMSLLLGD